jgi:hypothetical protein
MGGDGLYQHLLKVWNGHQSRRLRLARACRVCTEIGHTKRIVIVKVTLNLHVLNKEFPYIQASKMQAKFLSAQFLPRVSGRLAIQAKKRAD